MTKSRERREFAVRSLLKEKSCSPQKTEGRAFAPANIALCKYWGKRDLSLHLPITSSLSVTLGKEGTDTAVRLLPFGAREDRIIFHGKVLSNSTPFSQRLKEYLSLFRHVFRAENTYFHVATKNTIPTSAGLASSASGFAALILALDDLFGWNLERKTLSILARLGSGSACRSLYKGFVEWQCGKEGDGSDSYAFPLLQNAMDWQDFCVGILLIEEGEKMISSRKAMEQTVATSSLYSSWPQVVENDLTSLREALEQKNFPLLGEVAEGNALCMHATMIGARPAIIYSTEETWKQIKMIHQLREEGLSLYFTQDAGPNLKLLFLREDLLTVQKKFPEVKVITPFFHSRK